MTRSRQWMVWSGIALGIAIGVQTFAQGGAPQAPAPPTPAPAGPPQAPGGGGRGAAGGRGGGAIDQGYRLTFPAAQRGPGDPALIAQGKSLYEIHCRACHGADLRGGDMGGPNLVRSSIVLNDQKGELLRPVLREGRLRPGLPSMPPLPLPEGEITAVAEYLHSVLASGRGGGPAAPLNLLVGSAEAGRTYFATNCASCHSATGDMAGIGTKIPDVMALQNTWVAGMRVGGRENPVAPPARVTVTPAGGAPIVGRLVRMDDFLVAIKLTDGTERSFRRNGAVPKVEVEDPRAGHVRMWPTLTDAEMHNVTAYLVTLK